MDCCNRFSHCLFFLVFATLAFTPPAFSQARKKPTANAQRVHDAYMNAARILYGEGKYREAIEQFQKAHDAVPDPRVYFNLAQSYRLLDEVESALSYYNKFLEALPSIQGLPESRKTVIAQETREWIRQLEEGKRLKQERLEAERRRVLQEKEEKERMERELKEKEEKERMERLNREQASRLTRQWWFWTGVGVATLLAAGSGLAGLQATQANDDWKRDWNPPDRDRAVRFRDITDGLLLGSLTVGIAISVASWMHLRKNEIRVEGEASPMTFMPACSGSTCMITLTFDF